MSETLGYGTAAIVGVPLRYFLAETEACLRIGRAVSYTGSKTGFQNAVTPPASVNWALLTYFSVVGIIAYQAWAFGFPAAAISAVIIGAVAVISGLLLIPKPDSTFWTLRIYASLGARVADYRRDGDQLRADAAENLMRSIEGRLLTPHDDTPYDKSDGKDVDLDTSDIIAAFGEALIRRANAKMSGAVLDASMLPFPKKTILSAFVGELAIVEDESRRLALEGGERWSWLGSKKAWGRSRYILPESTFLSSDRRRIRWVK